MKTDIHFYSKTNYMHHCIKFILFWNDTLHVSDGISAHHQEFKTVHTATEQILLYIQSFTPDDGRKDRPERVEYHPKIK